MKGRFHQEVALLLCKGVNIINKLKLISPLPVSVNHYIKPRAFITHGKPQVTLYETNEAKKYKKEFRVLTEKEV